MITAQQTVHFIDSKYAIYYNLVIISASKIQMTKLNTLKIHTWQMRIRIAVYDHLHVFEDRGHRTMMFSANKAFVVGHFKKLLCFMSRSILTTLGYRKSGHFNFSCLYLMAIDLLVSIRRLVFSAS